jgi:hypothetical protein
MNWQLQAKIIANDLDSLAARIDDLPGHPKMTDAMVKVREAEKSLREAWGDLHQEELRKRYID